jgi:hypothetical protein
LAGPVEYQKPPDRHIIGYFGQNAQWIDSDLPATTHGHSALAWAGKGSVRTRQGSSKLPGLCYAIENPSKPK